MKGIKKTRTGWLIDIDIYTGRKNYYSGEKFGAILRTTKNPLTLYNNYYTYTIDAVIGLMYSYESLPSYVSVYRKGGIVK